MPKTLAQHKSELATRLGFGSQQGADIIQGPMLQSILQEAQTNILDEFGSQLTGTTVPATPFIDPNDPASVPDNALLMRALVTARVHYNQKPDADMQAWQNYEMNVRGRVG